MPAAVPAAAVASTKSQSKHPSERLSAVLDSSKYPASVIMPPPLGQGALSDDVRLASV